MRYEVLLWYGKLSVEVKSKLLCLVQFAMKVIEG